MRIMSYNLRCDTSADGENAWSFREHAVKAMWSTVDADIVGIQEGLPHQVQDLSDWFPGYVHVGQGRNADRLGESVSIFYKPDVLTCLETGDFWLSDSPDIPGSRSFGNTIPRMATWARFVNAEGDKYYVLNTHLDHRSEEARVHGAALIRDFLLDHLDDEFVVVTGDFNAGPNSKAVQSLLATNRFVDPFGDIGETSGTFHNFTGEGDARIDYIFTDPRLHIGDAVVVKERYHNKYPSDHFPVYVEIKGATGN